MKAKDVKITDYYYLVINDKEGKPILAIAEDYKILIKGKPAKNDKQVVDTLINWAKSL